MDRETPRSVKIEGNNLPGKPKLASGVFLVSSEKGSWLHSSTKTYPIAPELAKEIAVPLLSLLDGTKTVRQICRSLGNRNPLVIRYLLEVFHKAGFLEESETVSKNFRAERLSASSVMVIDTGVLGKTGLNALKVAKMKRGSLCKALLSGEEEKITNLASAQDLIVLAAHAKFWTLAHLLNEICLNLNKPLLLARVQAHRGTLTSVWPYKTACVSCMHLWRSQNDPHHENDVALDKAIDPVIWKEIEPEPAIKEMMGSLISLEANRLLEKPISAVSLQGELEINFETMKTIIRPVQKSPRCQSCSLMTKIPAGNLQDDFERKWRFDREKGEFIPL